MESEAISPELEFGYWTVMEGAHVELVHSLVLQRVLKKHSLITAYFHAKD
jgi:hypothetical protein